ncbi:MAG: Asp23/Gls24 family envelope stress response protein [Tyzzerella sp.]|nr:Asp23/Gls24 family envelope stress response protein [Tyzzerella sp.]
MGKDERNIYTINMNDNQGEVVVADEAIAVIAGIAAMEIEGIASLAGRENREMISKLGKKILSKGVKVDVLEDVVTIVITVTLKYGYNIMDVSEKIQNKVKTTVENMTGLTVADVNIRVAGVEVEA